MNRAKMRKLLNTLPAGIHPAASEKALDGVTNKRARAQLRRRLTIREAAR